ncbi:MAG: tRNA (guanosine(37)-N1)-methyltransferase TrmD [Alphaproteobacteria bacterium]|nr:tRNA (guanosine(37)-N1)-methyltransferase TrmD [Alphaproteobacteria bacterium]
MRFDILTLHPELCRGPVSGSILGRAQEAGLIDVGIHDLRDHAEGRHRQADDAPYGGGSGMVMKVDVVDRGIQAVRQAGGHVVLMDPVAPTFRQADALRLAQVPQLVLVCGHYEGVDARVREHLVDEALSIGDYVLTGGELAALVVLDAVARQVPGVLGNPDSLGVESFTPRDDGQVLLEAPQYTRPREYRGWEVPDVLLSGHHALIDAWRHERAVALTRRWRPDLLPPEDPD